jgi:hypothetical protein
LRHW